MPIVEIHSHTATSFNLITVEAGTNCPQGGDTGHGGRTVLRFIDNGGTDMRAFIDGEEFLPESLELVFGGDSEAETLLEGLEFAVEVLRSQLGKNSRTSDKSKSESID